MTLRTMAWALAPLALVGCGANGTWGMYFVKVEALPAFDCSDAEVTENFTNADPKGEEGAGEWTVTEEGTESPGALFAEIIELDAKKSAVLVVANETYDGIWDKDTKEWVFSWQNLDDGTSKSEHANGYTFTSDGLQQLDRTFRFNLKEGTGTLNLVSTTDLLWTETDEWDVGNGIFNGNIPGPQFLDGNATSNAATGPECDGAVCSLGVKQTCSASTTITFTKVKTDDAQLYDSVEDAGQTGGVPETN